MALKEVPKIGDKVRYIANEYYFMTRGKEYEVLENTGVNFACRDDDGHLMRWDADEYEQFELVTDSTPSVTELPSVEGLIANLARRVSELEACLAVEQAHREDLREQNAQQAYEINELYRAFVRKEAQI